MPHAFRGPPTGTEHSVLQWQFESHSFAQISKRHGVPQLLHRWNAVLPLVARGPAQQVSRSRLGGEGDAFPVRTDGESQPEGARREERDADDLSEHGLV